MPLFQIFREWLEITMPIHFLLFRVPGWSDSDKSSSVWTVWTHFLLGLDLRVKSCLFCGETCLKDLKSTSVISGSSGLKNSVNEPQAFNGDGALKSQKKNQLVTPTCCEPTNWYPSSLTRKHISPRGSWTVSSLKLDSFSSGKVLGEEKIPKSRRKSAPKNKKKTFP